MNRMKKFFALVLSVMMIAGVSTSVFAAGSVYELEGDSLQFTVPEGAYVFTPDTLSNDKQWAEAGIEDPVEYINLYGELGVAAHISLNNNADNIYLSKKTSDTTEYYHSLADASEADMKAFIDQFNSTSESGTTESTGELYEGGKFPFVRVHIKSEQIGESKVIYELHYITVVNGSSYSFNTHSESEITAGLEDSIKEIVNSVDFSSITPKAETTLNSQSVIMVCVIFLILALLIGMLVVSKMKRTREKKNTKILAARLTEYRRNQKEEFGPCLFENTTDHNNEAIREFSRYQTYRRHIFSACFSIVVTAGGAIASYYLNSAWWLTLAFSLAALYCIYKFATAANVMEKAIKRTYSKLRTTKAHYEFYADEFTVSGTQSHTVYPYFQISDVADNKNYFYIYFGEDVTSYVCKDSFTKGDAQEFGRFIKQKVKENKIK